ncbi:MAG: hypothetical protein AMXMBFR57_10140 [Acidimicrobiia bacterium]|jgi:hypothetical protein
MRLRSSLALLSLFIVATACDETASPSPTPTPSPTAAPAAAPPPGKVAGGIITELVSGDTACYVTLKPETGDPVTEMADFEICEKKELVGKRVTLTWEEGNVLAAECQGDVDCGKSEKVWLINKVQTQ